MADIKVREEVKRDIKTLDKTVSTVNRMKDTVANTKDKAESLTSSDSSPNEYAVDRTTNASRNVTNEAVRQFDKQGRRAVGETKDNVLKSKQYIAERKANKPKKDRKPKSPKSTADNRPIKTVNKEKRSIRTADKSVKPIEHKVKSGMRTPKSTVTTNPNAVKNTGKTVQSAKNAAKKAAQGIKTAAKAAVAGTKALASAVMAGGWVAVLIVVVICLVSMIAGSSFGIFLAREDAENTQSVQTVVRELDTEYMNHINAIKTTVPHDVLEMKGSRAAWKDVLAVYSVKTATDPDNPQEVVTMDDEKKAVLADIFHQMNVISYTTELKNDTVITESNDEYGNIIETETTAVRNHLYIAVSHKTAFEMADKLGFKADQRHQLAELLDEKNNSAWNTVLYGVGGKDIVDVAKSQLWNVGGEPYWSWYGFNKRVEWCACFVSWCANECGYIENGVVPKFASCSRGVQWFKDRGQWQDNSYIPKPGDIIFFDWSKQGGQDGNPDHVGIVEKVENGLIYTIEGNSNDSCKENSYPFKHYEILGYGAPSY